LRLVFQINQHNLSVFSLISIKSLDIYWRICRKSYREYTIF